MTAVSKTTHPRQVCVVGGGIVGVTTALALAERGHAVTLLEAADSLAEGATARNGGQLSFCYTDALASPDIIPSFPKMVLGLDDAFRFRVKPTLSSVQWVLRFLVNCTQSTFEANTLMTLALAQLSKQTMERWIKAYDIDFAYRIAGKLHLYGTSDSIEKQRHKMQLKAWFGVRQQHLTRDQVLEIEPALHGFEGALAGAIYSPDEAVGDAQKFTRGVADILINTFGVDVKLNVRVTGATVSNDRLTMLKTTSGDYRSDAFFICAGLHSNQITRLWSETLPLMPMAGYSLTYPANENLPEISLTDVASKSVLCRLGSHARFAGFADLGEHRSNPDKRRIQMLRQTLKNRFGLASQGCDAADVWIGHRSMTPYSRPIVRKARVDGAYLNCGHGMLGWTLSSGSADMLADEFEKHIVPQKVQQSN